MPSGTSGLQDEDVKRSNFRIRTRSHEAKGRFGGLMEALILSAFLGEVGFSMFFCTLPSLLSSDMNIHCLCSSSSLEFYNEVFLFAFILAWMSFRSVSLRITWHDQSILLYVLWWDWLTVVFRPLFVRYAVDPVYFLNSPAYPHFHGFDSLYIFCRQTPRFGCI